jgi:uncharacterized radical SAM superfamily protein
MGIKKDFQMLLSALFVCPACFVLKKVYSFHLDIVRKVIIALKVQYLHKRFTALEVISVQMDLVSLYNVLLVLFLTALIWGM